LRFRTPRELKSGWTTWQQPVMRGYLMQCCDCGLVHEMEFRALRRFGRLTNGKTWKADKLDQDRYRVEFRVKRYEIEDEACS
jgi:hypothetical protein